MSLSQTDMESNLAYIKPALVHCKQHYVCSENAVKAVEILLPKIY